MLIFLLGSPRPSPSPLRPQASGLSPHPLLLRPQASGLSPHPYEYDYDYGIIYHHVDILGGVAPPLGLKGYAVDTAVHLIFRP